MVLITVNKYETAGVIKHFSPGSKSSTENRKGADYNLLGLHGGMRVVHVISKPGAGEAQASVHDAITVWQPRAVIALGIAFGVNPAKQKIGDVLVAEAIRGYELARVNADGSITPRGDKPPTSHVLFSRFKFLDQMKHTNPATATHWPTVHCGTLLSGNKLVDNLNYRTSLLALEPEAIGGEMEAVGVQLAADRSKVDWIVVKAISDWGDGNKSTVDKKRDQRIAGDHAALVVKAALDIGSLYLNPDPDSGATQRGPRINFPDKDFVSERHWISSTGARANLDKNLRNMPRDAAERGTEVMPYLLDWVNAPDAPALFALLGEYGMGKTVISQKLCTLLNQRLEADTTQAIPLLFDLRNLTGLDKRVPTLRETLEECMARGWQTPATISKYTLEHVLQWMDRGAVIILDGLDEVLVKLSEADGQIFTNTLLKLLFDTKQRPTLRGKPRMLLTCRTQYFRTLPDQNNHFTGQERGEHNAGAYRAMLLLPLTEDQVLGYLRAAAPDGIDAERLLDTIRSVHNLEELTQRPYTLKLVTEFIPEIESDRLAGRTVYGVTLYRRMVQRWLERDSGKHHIKPEHKLRLAAHLAAHLWNSRRSVLPAESIESWFHAWLEQQSDINRRYASLPPDHLEEDLRTATFLARQDDEGASGFRFAHTSLQEFFLADYLFQAQRSDAPQRWAMPVPSSETLDFLGQMFAEAADTALLQTLQGWRHTYRAQASELLLAYTLAAKGKGWPAPLLQGINLRGAVLRAWRFNERAGDPHMWSDHTAAKSGWLDLSGADFSGADLREVQMAGVHLSGAKFDRARLDQAVLLRCRADQASFAAAELTGAIFRDGSLIGARFDQAQGHRTQFLHTSPGLALQESRLKQSLIAPCADRLLSLAPSPSAHPQLRWLVGHAGGINACAWSPDGARLLSGGRDGTLLVWDAASGELLHTLTGHKDWIMSCAWSPDGARLLSGGYDRTLRVWDAASGELLHTLTGHGNWINACAWSRDGARLLSGGDDGTLRVWDALTGVPLRVHAVTPYGHAAWLPQENTVLVVGGDAWRWLAWQVQDADGWLTRLPLETFGNVY